MYAIRSYYEQLQPDVGIALLEIGQARDQRSAPHAQRKTDTQFAGRLAAGLAQRLGGLAEVGEDSYNFV